MSEQSPHQTSLDPENGRSNPRLQNRLREILNTQRPAYGTFITLSDPVATELAALAGFEFVALDCEHAAMSIETAQSHLRASRVHGLGALVRVPEGDWGFAQRILDAGADGILVPHVSDVAGCQRAVQAARYPPLGARGMYPAGAASRYGVHDIERLDELTAWHNESVVLAIMVEEVTAVEQIGEIVATNGVDLVVVGPADLAASAGQLDDPNGAEMNGLINRVFDACRLGGCAFGMPANHRAHSRTVESLIASGAWFITLGSDTAHLLNALRAARAIRQGSQVAGQVSAGADGVTR